MAFTAKDYSPDDLADILAGTQKVLANTWELSWLRNDVAELVAFLIHAIQKDPGIVTEPFIANVASFWSLTIADVEAAVLDLLAMHEESTRDSIVEDLITLEVIFTLLKKRGCNFNQGGLVSSLYFSGRRSTTILSYQRKGRLSRIS